VITRRLGPADWRPNREIRLEALAGSPGAYFTSSAEAAARSDMQWQAMVADPDTAVFGLFDAEPLIGLTAIYIDKEDPTGRTAGLAMSYIRPAWRDRGLTKHLYEARLDWAQARLGARAGQPPRRQRAVAPRNAGARIPPGRRRAASLA
jgi:GNAT superfamily N-acetyltransferase